jgi:dephospho-CoA kinase
MIKIGITGSIASGKTTVAKMLAGKKYPLFDADNEVRKIYKTNLFKSKVRKKFSLANTKNIKKKIIKVISQNKENLKKLEKMIHPLVRKGLRNFIKKNKNKEILIFEIPLLIESRLMKTFTKVVFVNSKKKIRLKRYLKKGKNKKTFNFLDKRQLPPVKKIKFSDYVINNNNSLEFLKKNVKIIKNNL